MHNALLAVAMLLTQVPQGEETAEAPAVEQAPLEPPNWEIFVGVAGGIRTDTPGGGGVGIIGINRRVFSWLRPELSVGLGMYATPLDAVIPIKIGTRIEWPSDSWIKPYLFLAFAHVHELGWEETKADPISGLLGLSSHGDHGVHHRSGLDSGVGVSFDFPHFKGSRFGGKLNVRASLTHLLGEGPSRYVDLIATFGVTL